MGSILWEKLLACLTKGSWPTSGAEYALLAAVCLLFGVLGLIAGYATYRGGRRPIRDLEAENRKDRERVELYRATVERQESAWA